MASRIFRLIFGGAWFFIVAVVVVQEGRASSSRRQVIVRLKESSKIHLSASGQGPRAQSVGAMDSLLKSVHASSFRPLLKQSIRRRGNVKSSAAYRRAQGKLERTYVIPLEGRISVEEAVKILERNPDVEVCEPDKRVTAFRTPDDSNFNTQYGLHNTGQSGSIDGADPATGVVGRDIDAVLGWDTQTGDSRVVVAVIDAGVDWDHPDLASNIWNNTGETNGNSADDDGNGYVDDIRGWDFGDNDNNPNDDCFNADPLLDARQHGTHVAGIVAALGNNGVGVTGVGWTTTLMPLKVASSDCAMLISDISAALVYAVADGAQVVNMSLGGGDSATMSSAITAADQAGVLLVAAAGNSSTTATTFSYPAAYPEVIAVAATDRNDQRASFSNYGTWITLSAPGEAINSTIPFGEGGYGYKSGTSMASPMVAGVAALILAQYPALSSTDVLGRLRGSSENIDSLNLDTSGLLGAGRVNLARALTAVTGVSPSSGLRNETASLTVSGVSLVSELTVFLSKTGEANITATHVTYISSTSMTCDVDLTGASLGAWDVVVNDGNLTQSLSGGFTVESLTLTAMAPSQGANTGMSPEITLTGSNFSSGMTISLSRTGQTAIPGTGLTRLSATASTVTFDLGGQVGGRWDVNLTNGDVTSTIKDGFVITSEVFDVVLALLDQESTFTLHPPQGTHRVVWPSGTVSQDIQLELNAIPTLPSVDSALDAYQGTGIGLEITPAPSGVSLTRSFSLTMSYRLSDLVDSSNEDALVLAVYNSTTTRWEPLASTVDKTAKTVSASPTHLSLFAIVQHAPSMTLNKVVAFPNPFRSDLGHSRIVFDFLTAGSRVRIYDVAGTLIRDLTDGDQDGQVFWGVTNEGGQKVASGMYFYLVTDSQGRKKTGRIGIIR